MRIKFPPASLAILDFVQPSGGAFTLAGGWNKLADLPKAKGRHVVINGLVTAGAYAVGLMPDPHIAGVADPFGEGRPCGQMMQGGIAGVTLQLFERAPVLQHDRGASKPILSAQQTQLGLLDQFLNHLGHRQENWQPLVNFPGSIESHSDEKHTKITLHHRGHALG